MSVKHLVGGAVQPDIEPGLGGLERKRAVVRVPVAALEVPVAGHAKVHREQAADHHAERQAPARIAVLQRRRTTSVPAPAESAAPFGGFENVATARQDRSQRHLRSPFAAIAGREPPCPWVTCLNSQQKYASVTITRLNSSGVVHTR